MVNLELVRLSPAIGPRLLDHELGMPRPLLEGGAIEALAHTRGHLLEGALGIVSDHLVQMAEPRRSRGLVLPGCDRPVSRHGRLGNVPKMHEVAPIAQFLRGLALLGRDEYQQDACCPLTRARSLRRTGVTHQGHDRGCSRRRLHHSPIALSDHHAVAARLQPWQIVIRGGRRVPDGDLPAGCFDGRRTCVHVVRLADQLEMQPRR